MKDDSFRTIQSLGRTELIDELMEYAEYEHPSVKLGYGDDAAVLKGEDDFKLTTSETFMEGVNFDLTYVPLHHLGYKIATAAVSDIYAMNGTPEVVNVDLAVPNKLSVDMLKEIYRGIGAASKDYQFQIVGGDLTASHKTLSVSISCYGSVAKEDIIYRKGAQVGDAICVTGDLGGAIAGLRILMREKKFWQEQEEQTSFQPDLDDYEYVVKRQLVPAARNDFIEQIGESSLKPTAMIDVTQGLVSELQHLTSASDVGSYVYQAAFPIALDTRTVADEMREEVDRYALYGGEDYELMFTLPEEQVETLADEFQDFVVIGKITDKEEGLCMQQAEGGVVTFGEEDETNS
ncbi:thiamine-phosphate kinase [Fodinibius halophilus]|uniref:Thiamine-monophosphate kinase n=1 Tax=Fodinibius halophilus TaxID=1736908 RepID=A0A6M1TGH1_9BACT|nr:thiamine-phosphate kinase [Fodinibius halophilus]NGP87750.1 thiamine-phosphate kinase [Fodinibius halophilus]